MLPLVASSPAQASAELFASQCYVCHNNADHPLGLVYNAAGNAAIIETVNALGMGASGSAADHMSIATYLDSIKPTITLAPVEHDSPGTVIPLFDIIVSKSDIHAFLKIIQSIVTVTPPTKGGVTYHWGNGFGAPSTVTYRPFAGQSGTDTWTYQVKVETSAEALHEARSQLGKREARQALGIARIRRFRGEAADPEAGEHRIALEGLDDGHLVDRLTSAILTWHADLNGVGPRAATPPIRARRLRG